MQTVLGNKLHEMSNPNFRKNNKNIISLLSAEFAHCMVSVKSPKYHKKIIVFSTMYLYTVIFFWENKNYVDVKFFLHIILIPEPQYYIM